MVGPLVACCAAACCASAGAPAAVGRRSAGRRQSRPQAQFAAQLGLLMLVAAAEAAAEALEAPGGPQPLAAGSPGPQLRAPSPRSTRPAAAPAAALVAAARRLAERGTCGAALAVLTSTPQQRPRAWPERARCREPLLREVQGAAAAAVLLARDGGGAAAARPAELPPPQGRTCSCVHADAAWPSPMAHRRARAAACWTMCVGTVGRGGGIRGARDEHASLAVLPSHWCSPRGHQRKALEHWQSALCLPGRHAQP